MLFFGVYKYEKDGELTLNYVLLNTYFKNYHSNY